MIPALTLTGHWLSVVQCIQAGRRSEDNVLEFEACIRIRTKGDLSDFEHGERGR